MYCRAKEWGLSRSDPDSTIAWVRLLNKAKNGKEEEKKMSNGIIERRRRKRRRNRKSVIFLIGIYPCMLS
jgi:hypothetical protein